MKKLAWLCSDAALAAPLGVILLFLEWHFLLLYPPVILATDPYGQGIFPKTGFDSAHHISIFLHVDHIYLAEIMQKLHHGNNNNNGSAS